MFVDPTKMRSARDRRALTQEALAHQARVNVRTIQRAESGQPVQAETVAEIAAVLGLPVTGLVRSGPVKEQETIASEPPEGQTHVLKRVEKGELVVASLERCEMSILECSAEPTSETMPALRGTIIAIEGLMRDPWEVDNCSPLRFASLLSRLDEVVKVNTALAELDRSGMALYMGVTTEYVRVPQRSEEGKMTTSQWQSPEYVRATRFLLAEYSSERLRVPANVVWPLQVEEEEEIPF